jgi:DNA-binding ferritin-like protein
MQRTKKQALRSKGTRKRSISSKSFEKEIVVRFLEMLMMVKLFHWKTHSFATHKVTDELYSSLNENMDKFVEVLLGKSGSRINLTNQTKISLIDLESQAKLKAHIESFKDYLVGLSTNPFMKSKANTDLVNIRDEILQDMNKFLYLLTFK